MCFPRNSFKHGPASPAFVFASRVCSVSTDFEGVGVCGVGRAGEETFVQVRPVHLRDLHEIRLSRGLEGLTRCSRILMDVAPTTLPPLRPHFRWKLFIAQRSLHSRRSRTYPTNIVVFRKVEAG